VDISRREFLKLLGVTTAATTLGAWSASTIFSVPDEVFERVITGRHIETWKNSICTQCPGGCGIRVRLIDNIPVRVTGNPLYPINRGAVCPIAEAGIENLFQPNRIRQPLKRAGERGENRWEKISWEEAIGTITNRLQNLRTRGSPEKLVLVTRDNNEITSELLSRFMRAFGSPNFFSQSDAGITALPSILSQGFQKLPAYDLANTNFALNFGGDFLDDAPTPVRFNQLYASLRGREKQKRARIVHIGSYMSRTAVNSSEWVPIKPGTMAALALGFAYVIIRDGSYDKNFINDHTFGFLDWKDDSGNGHKGFKQLITEEYSPEKVTAITSVPAKKIIEIARGFAETKPALAISGKEATAGTNSLYTSWAIYCLNALKGNFQQPGGLLFPKEMISVSVPEIKMDDISRKGFEKPKIGVKSDFDFTFNTDSFDQLLPALLENEPYEIDTIIFHAINPLFESTNQQQYAAALERAPFIISCDSFMNETNAYADLILPEHIFLENWEASRGVPTVEFLHFGVQQPVIEPLYNTRNFGDVILELGRKLGGPVAEALPWGNYQNFVGAHAEAIFNSGQGSIVSESVDLSWIEFLKKRGWQPLEYSTFEEFWDVLLENGGWWDPTSPGSKNEKIFDTQSSKFEFYSQTLQSEIDKLVGTNSKTEEEIDNLFGSWKIDARGDLLFLPHFEAPRFDNNDNDFPYHLLAYPLLTNRNEGGDHLRLLQELSGLHSREYWNSWAEIHPQTAKSLGISDSDFINIISPKGQLLVVTKVLPTVMPDVIMIPFGAGHKPVDRVDKTIGVNPYKVFASDTDLICGISSLISTKVRIEKANIEKVT
jgi:anaerobic selenocysteine-containing dehydrogenase